MKIRFFNTGRDYQVETISSPSGVTHLIFTRSGV